MVGVRQQGLADPGEQHPESSHADASPAGRAPSDAEQRPRPLLHGLRQTIEREVVPRLVLAHRAVPVAPSRGECPEVAALVDLVLGADPDAPVSYLAARHAEGVAVDALYLDLLAPAARHLGWLWEEDFCDFAQVTIALGRLHHLVRMFSMDFHSEGALGDTGRHALLVPAPGESHTFGLAMVTEFFRRGGWSVWSGAPRDLDELLGIVRGEWFAVVGFSLACGTRLDALASAIRRVRRASRNRAIGVMVGGPMFVASPELAALVGADATASDARLAVGQAQALLTLLAGSG